MFMYEYDFKLQTEVVADTLPDSEDEEDIGDKRPLGQYACKVLSVDYEELSHKILGRLVESGAKNLPYPDIDISEILSDTFGEISCNELDMLVKILKNTYTGVQKTDSDMRELILRLNDSIEEYYFNTIFRSFWKIVALQAYLEESENISEMLSAEKFELFISAAYEGEETIIKRHLAENISSVTLEYETWPGADMRGIVRTIFSELLPFGNDFICMSAKSLFDFLVTTVYYVFLSGYRFKRCKNCGRFFVPLSRSDELYCNQPSPQDDSRSCKQYGSDRLWYDKLKQDEAAKLARNIYMAKQMLVKRNPDILGYKKMFEYFKTERKKWEVWVSSGVKSRDEYISWLNEMKAKKAL